MSVLIRGMEMPKSCIKCKLCVSYKCVLTGEIRWSDEFDYDSKRFEDCPLFPVPPHGDLIDRDAERLNDEIFKLRAFKSRFDIKEMLDAATVVVPAEEGE